MLININFIGNNPNERQDEANTNEDPYNIYVKIRDHIEPIQNKASNSHLS